MKKYIFILFTACLFASCNSDILFDEHWGSVRADFEETNMSFIEVLSSAEYWSADFIESVRYTEPNGKGKSYSYSATPSGGPILPGISVLLGDLRFYHPETSIPGILPSFYRDIPYRIEEDMILFKPEVVEPANANAYFGNDLKEGEYYFKILDYDDTKVLVETNYNKITISGVEYPYIITVLHKGEAPSIASFATFEEWLKAFETYQANLDE